MVDWVVSYDEMQVDIYTRSYSSLPYGLSEGQMKEHVGLIYEDLEGLLNVDGAPWQQGSGG